jgi:hypothetical protein
MHATMCMSRNVYRVRVVDSGRNRKSIVGARAVQFSEVLLEESPVEYVNCEGARGRLYAEVLF